MSEIDGRMTAALASVFRPLAGMLLKAGVGVRPVIEVLKRCFVDAALNEHGTNSKPASISKISRLTGLTRSEVRRLAAQEGVAEMPGRLLGSVESAILSVWHTNPLFHDENGKPAPLPMSGAEQSFEELVRAATGERNIESALADLEKRGCVSITDTRMVELERRMYVQTDLPLLLGDGLGTLANTIGKNWARLSATPPEKFDPNTIPIDPDRMEQMSAHIHSVDASALMSVRRACNERVIRFMEETDDYLMPFQVLPEEADDSVEVTRTHRIGVGAYYFEIEAPEE